MKKRVSRVRAGLVGAGTISEVHIQALRPLPGVELAGITDIDARRGRQTSERFHLAFYPSLEALVAAGVDIIHVLTPPHTHASVAIKAMELGCHVLIEKPLAEDLTDCQNVMDTARRTGRVVTVDHSLLYDPQVKRALQLVRAGSLGTVVAVDIFRASQYPPYEGGPLPPHYRTAGYPFRDSGVHCYYLLQELLGPIESVDASWRSLGGDPNLAFDEWRAIVRCRYGMGHFQLSWNARPLQSQMIIQGTRGILRVDLFAMVQGKRSATPLPKAVERVLNTLTDSVQPLIDLPIGVWSFVRRKVQPYQGVRNLVADFYRRLAAGEPPPVSLEDATTMVRWTEHVARAAERDHAARISRFTLTESVPVLVTGASGSLGSAIVQRLRDEGKRVRAFVRRVPQQPVDGVEYALGNLGDPDAVDRAVRGAERVIHVGAAMKGSWPEHYGSTVVGTANVLASVVKHGVTQLVHVSTLSVLDLAGSAGGDPISPATPLDPRPEERGAYTRAKLAAEQLVMDAVRKHGLPAAILRPGLIFGRGIPAVGSSVAQRVGRRWVVLGDGALELPLVYIDDVVDAVLLVLEHDFRHAEIIHIVDPEKLTQNDLLLAVGVRSSVARVPRLMVFTAAWVSDLLFGVLGRKSPISLYRMRSGMARLRFDSDSAARLLGWVPRVGVREGLRRWVTGTEGEFRGADSASRGSCRGQASGSSPPSRTASTHS